MEWDVNPIPCRGVNGLFLSLIELDRAIGAGDPRLRESGMAKALMQRVRSTNSLGPLECAMIAGGIAATAIFASRWIGSDLAPVLMKISLGF